jgi:hypothetical protein
MKTLKEKLGIMNLKNLDGLWRRVFIVTIRAILEVGQLVQALLSFIIG